MSTYSAQNIFDRIARIRVNKSSGKVSPHKYIFLLSLIELYEQNPSIDNRFILNTEFELTFKSIWHDFFPNTPPQEIFVENPFSHLVNDGFWHFKIVQDKQAIYNKYVEDKKRMTKKRIIETVEYGFLDAVFHEKFSDNDLREEIKAYIIHVLEVKQTRFKSGHQVVVHESSSLYVHEATAIKQIANAVQSRKLGYICSNIDIHDPQSNRFFEIDLLIVCRFGLYVVELKHWTGNVKVYPYTWTVNGLSRTNPHKGNNFKAKLVRGLCQQQYSYLNLPYVESVVTLTHPEVQVEGNAHPGTDKKQPTFGSIDQLISYLKAQRDSRQSLLSDEDTLKIRDYIASLHQPGRAYNLQFPGYEIVERLYQTPEREEVIARQTDIRHRHLTRLRVFFNTAQEDKNEAGSQMERARATLNAVANIGDHPNILRVWSIPHEDGYLIEGSDWSEQGTLRDTILQSAPKPIELNRTLMITRGVLAGLTAIHEKGFVHRNLSPENILLVGNTPKLMNFDLSYQLADDRMTSIPDPTELKRQPYIAPEIYQGEAFSDDADLFSVGVLMYQMLTGERPFKYSLDLVASNGKLRQQCIDKLMSNKIPDNIVELISDLVQLDRKLRPVSVSDVLERFDERVEDQLPVLNAQLQPGDEYEQYKIIEFRERGSESQIYKAQGPLGEILFLKLFNIDVSQERIISEKKLSAAVTHNNIIKAEYCQRWTDQRWLLAFRWVEGSTLFERKNEKLPEIEPFIRITQAQLKALEVLHAFEEDGVPNPILHNDIKPDNIIITPEGRPMLIDFGIASHPNTSLYAGTNGYVPPETLSGEDREYSVQGDLFGLGVTLFEWFFGCKPYDILTVGAEPIDIQALRPDLAPALKLWFLRAIASRPEQRFFSAKEMYTALQDTLSSEDDVDDVAINIVPENVDKKPASNELEVATFPLSVDAVPNPFVVYLNTLHNRDVSSGNALAENQACNEWFGRIQVGHPLADRIKMELLDKRRHVILTGHAGDGKSTIALELLKQFRGIPAHEPLQNELKRCEDIDVNGHRVVLIKDFSEWDDDARIKIIEDAAGAEASTLLLISNTGTLLDSFHKFDQRDGRDWLGAESNFLQVFSQSVPTSMTHNGVEYLVINLAMFDNLLVARTIFERMLSEERWQPCDVCTEQESCPIRRNVSLLQENPVAVDRIFLLYRRMFEYGDRFTLRQLVAHIAYLVTAGMEYRDIVEYVNRPVPPLMSEFMFYNRFFGDNGRASDKPAHQMQIVRTACSREFGERSCSSWERRLWLREDQTDFRLKAKGNISEFSILRQIGAKQKQSLFYEGEQGHYLARKQIRRMLFFLHNFSNNAIREKKDKRDYLSSFLRSPMLLDLLEWRDHAGRLSPKQETDLKRRILHVLQEDFTGVRIPEGTSFDSSLYVTLSRNVRDIRQSAQVVLADFRARDFRILFESGVNKNNSAHRLLFVGTGQYESAKLILELPFLDYVMMRHHGETGQLLQTAFSDRLDHFKSKLVELGKTDGEEQNIMLLRLQTNHTFRELNFFVGNEKLEVVRNA